MSKIISVCGMERGDFAYFLAVSLSKSDKIVLVVDNSHIHDIYTAVSDDKETPGFIIKQNITYIKNALINKDYDGMFDYVIVWHGLNINKDILNNSDFIYVLPNYERSVLKRINNAIEDKSLITEVILRDSVMSNKLSDKKIAQELGIAPEKIKYTLIYDSKDYETYLAFLYNGRQTFGVLTPVYNECLTHILSQILEINIKDAAKLFKKAKTAQGN